MPPPDDDRRDDDDRPRRKRRRDDDEYDDDDDDDRPRRRRRDAGDDVSPASFIVPLGVSPLSIASLYLSILGCVLVPLAPIALICGILALRKRKKANSYGAVTSDVRAWIGVVLSGLTTLVLLVVGVLYLLTSTGVLK